MSYQNQQDPPLPILNVVVKYLYLHFNLRISTHVLCVHDVLVTALFTNI